MAEVDKGYVQSWRIRRRVCLHLLRITRAEKRSQGMNLDYKREDKIAYFTLNRPEALNALSSDFRRGLHEA